MQQNCLPISKLCVLRMPSPHEVNYVIWQNRAVRFYLAARLLHRYGLAAPAAFSATQALEVLLKATLVYWDKSFQPEAAGHAIAKLTRTVRNKVRGAKEFDVPRYFFHEQRYHAVTRYPSGGKGLLLPASFLQDLDTAFATLVGFVPFQHNTELKRALAGRDAKTLAIIRHRNAAVRGLRKVLGVTAPRRTTQHSANAPQAARPLS
jgi:HEPN domain-containing protein